MDSTETAPGLPAEQREATDTAARPETGPGAIVGAEAGEAVDMPEAAAGGAASQTGEGMPHPRRRRRRRRRPAQAATAPGAGTGSDAVAGEAPLGDGEATPETAEAPGEAAGTETAVEHGGEAPAEAGSQEGAAAERPVLRLRNRRRRRRPPVLGLLPGHSDPVPAGEGAPPAIAAIRAALAPGQRSFSVPRRQRRHAPLSGEPVPAASGDAAPRAAEAGAEPGGAPARPRRRRRRGPTDAAAPGQVAGAGEAAVQGENSGRDRRRGGLRQGEAEGGGQRDRNQRDRGPRDRGRDRGDRGGRGALPRRVVEQKLYSVDAIVDRGFEDIEEEEGETRRVHWTIVKRTTADQISRKPVATVYVLQREGADTEFPTLGTARSAVNKTIVHPEKLTPSKAERAIAKK